MVAAAAATAIFQAASPAPESGLKSSGKLGGSIPSSIGARGSGSKSAASGRLQASASAQAPYKVNGTKVGLHKIDDDVTPSHAPRTFINTLPDWSMLLAAITTIFLAAEKQWMMLEWKPKRPDILADPFSLGKIVTDGLIFRQNFSIRSYEAGADRTASIETIMNHLQETALNHVKNAGLLGDGLVQPQRCAKEI